MRFEVWNGEGGGGYTQAAKGTRSDEDWEEGVGGGIGRYQTGGGRGGEGEVQKEDQEVAALAAACAAGRVQEATGQCLMLQVSTRAAASRQRARRISRCRRRQAAESA